LANDRFTLQVECAQPPAGLAMRLQDALRDITRLRAEVQFQAELPNDGKVIDDRRVV
jgi:phenylacetate-CoA ligase